MRHHGTYYITNNYSSLRFVLLRVGTSDSLVVREDEFWLSANVVRQKPRNRRYAALSLRRPDRIAAQEYRLAINAVLRGSVAASKSELTASVARVLGFDRTGNDLDRSISDQIDWMIQTAEIADIGGRLEITR